MAKRSGLVELNNILSNQKLITLYVHDHGKQFTLTFISGMVDFDNRTVVLMNNTNDYYRTRPIKDILVEDDTLHKTFFMKSFHDECFEISVYQTVET